MICFILVLQVIDMVPHEVVFVDPNTHFSWNPAELRSAVWLMQFFNLVAPTHDD